MKDTRTQGPQSAGLKPWRSLRPLRWIGLFFLALLGCTGGPPKHPTWKNATGSEQHEQLMWKAIKDKDWSKFQDRLAPAFVGVDAAGKTYDRQGWIDYWKNAGVSDYAMGEAEVHPAGSDLVITYVITLASPHVTSGQRMRAISVWQPVKSGLILIASSITAIRGSETEHSEPPKPDHF